MRILLADDEDGLRRSLAQWLERWGYEVVAARDGDEAWRLLKREDAPRVAILDWEMPGLSGLEVCRLLRATPHGGEAYVLVLTAKGEKDDLVEALEAGADDFLTKPFHARELQLRLAKGVREAARANSARAPVSVPPPSGYTLGGKYRLEGKIADGGMGSVWHGVHLSLGIDVAIKFMASQLAETSHYASFEREARAAARLQNEHIVRVYDHGISFDGLPYLVMEYIAGESLSDRIDRLGPLSPAEAVALVEQACEALGEAHAQGVVHRDVKPDNILLVNGARRGPFSAKLIDFGLANPGGAHAAPGLAGTPSYLSPEYLRGEAPPSPLLDLWGLAATAFRAVTGRTAFAGQSLDEIYRKVCAEPPPLPSKAAPGTPPAFDAWFLRACAADPGARFPNAGEFASAFALAMRDAGRAPAAGAGGAAKATEPTAPTEPDAKRLTAPADRARPRG
ncbi:MAG TPA: response regulator [Polyangiaceae bacterium]|nr:response regulator [Polyangiaceae bacterium]